MNFVTSSRLTMGVFTAVMLTNAAQAYITVTVDGSQVDFKNTQPRMMNNRVMVPLRGVFEHMGASVDWNNTDQSITCEKTDMKIFLHIGSTSANVNGKNVSFDSPPVMRNGATYVPVRFLSETLGGDVVWNDDTQTVQISTIASADGSDNGMHTIGSVYFQPNTVVPLTLDKELNSSTASVGDRFSATVNTNNQADYSGLPQGTQFLGHVNVVRVKKGDMPGVLGLVWDRVRTPDGRTFPVQASIIGLDEKSIENRDGRLVAIKSTKKNETLKYVGLGAGGGALIAMITKGNVVTDAILGGALGFLYDQLLNKDKKVHDVVLESGTPIGVRFDEALAFKTRS